MHKQQAQLQRRDRIGRSTNRSGSGSGSDEVAGSVGSLSTQSIPSIPSIPSRQSQAQAQARGPAGPYNSLDRCLASALRALRSVSDKSQTEFFLHGLGEAVAVTTSGSGRNPQGEEREKANERQKDTKYMSSNGSGGSSGSGGRDRGGASAASALRRVNAPRAYVDKFRGRLSLSLEALVHHALATRHEKNEKEGEEEGEGQGKEGGVAFGSDVAWLLSLPKKYPQGMRYLQTGGQTATLTSGHGHKRDREREEQWPKVEEDLVLGAVCLLLDEFEAETRGLDLVVGEAGQHRAARLRKSGKNRAGAGAGERRRGRGSTKSGMNNKPREREREDDKLYYQQLRQFHDVRKMVLAKATLLIHHFYRQQRHFTDVHCLRALVLLSDKLQSPSIAVQVSHNLLFYISIPSLSQSTLSEALDSSIFLLSAPQIITGIAHNHHTNIHPQTPQTSYMCRPSLPLTLKRRQQNSPSPSECTNGRSRQHTATGSGRAQNCFSRLC